MTPLQFKVATEPDEWEQIHRLNHRTFAEEIPQHPVHPERRLVDRFHAGNRYLIALQGERVVGMLAMRGQRPFSLDGKLPDLDHYLPPGRRLCEIRLLAVEEKARGGRVFQGLLERLTVEFVRCGFDLALISGTVRQLRLYRHLGFIPFGPLVGSADALFQPMYLTLESHLLRARRRRVRVTPGDETASPLPVLA